MKVGFGVGFFGGGRGGGGGLLGTSCFCFYVLILIQDLNGKYIE